ncbi:GTP-binding protein [Streptomyces sp. Ag109_G2-15]|uniref:GTP-binding protein n=1 Tax=Streptomyces sp. Ag109_G2-15 TaxID=1938850 RepID=UPI000BCFE09F|nr:GTP-binding protein [Streptomyces sp. Ag109_G2-15]SOE07110.1 small GTP-binding protein domain-containing protein [Streptomyces sp. Ag109_G2-15]
MHLLNLGILAHVDAGKTSLTERLLHAAGVTDEIGSVDAGSTRTDTLALERQRGITIKSAVVSFPLDSVTVNLIDTPGHPDFIAEVERVLGVLDGAVLVVSAVEGVQAQTRVLMRTLRRLRIPTLVFVNKIDRRGARDEAVLRELARRLAVPLVPMGTATALGTRDARFVPRLGPSALDALTDHDDDLLTAYVTGDVPDDRLHTALATQTRQALVHPVYFGSAITGAGVPELITGIERLLPPATGDPDAPLSGTVFKVERGPAGEKIAYARIFSGTLRVRDRVPFGGGGEVGEACRQEGEGGRAMGGADQGVCGVVGEVDGVVREEAEGGCVMGGVAHRERGAARGEREVVHGGCGGGREEGEGGCVMGGVAHRERGAAHEERGVVHGECGGVREEGKAGRAMGRAAHEERGTAHNERGSVGEESESGRQEGKVRREESEESKVSRRKGNVGRREDGAGRQESRAGRREDGAGRQESRAGRREERAGRQEGRAGRREGRAARQEARITGLAVFERGTDTRQDRVGAGRIAKVWGLGGIRIGDALGVPGRVYEHHFAPPTLETVVVPGPGTDRRSLHLALTQLAEQDPLIGVRHDELRGETSVSLYGEVQKEVIQATLADEYGLDVTFRETTTLCIERLVGTGQAVEFNKRDPNPFLATVGLRVDPAPPGAGVRFRLEVELGSMPYAFFKAVEDTVRETLGQGPHGWRIPDCTVTMTHSGYSPRQSHAHQGFDKSMSSTGYDFRGLTPLVLIEALRRAGTLVYEPMHRFRIEAPADTLGALLPVLARLGAVPESTGAHGREGVLEGAVPAARVHELEQRLPGLTRGEGELESSFDHYAPVTRGPLPERPRTDHNPLNRKEYLLNVTRRVGD